MTSPGGQGENRTANVTLHADVDPYTQQMAAATAQTNTMAGSVDKLTAKLHTLSQTAGRKLVHFTQADFASLAGATATAALFEKQLGSLRASADVSGTSFKGLKGSVESAFTGFRVSRGEVVDLTNALTNMGVKGVKDIHSLTQTFIRLGEATGEPTAELASQLTQLSRLMGTGNAQVGNYANSLLVVSKNAGVSATGVLSFAQAIAPMARAAGIGEAAVIGISAAFSKAGADGYPAATAFNKIIGDISGEIASGSPDLAKFSNLIGVTTDEFKKMDKADALTRIFDTLQKQGPQAVNTLNRLGLDGVRTMKSLQAVAQSGGLGPSIAQALGASHDQKALKSASAKATEGLSDQLVRVRNNFTQLGTEVGTTFLVSLTKALQIFNRMFDMLNQIIKPFAPLIGAVGALAGAFSGLGATALLTAGTVAKIAGARWLINSSPIKALRGGITAGRGTADGSPVDNEAARLNAAGKLRAWQKPFFTLGAGLGSLAGAPAAEGSAPGRVSRVVAGAAALPLRAARMVVEGQSDFLRASRQSGFERKAPVLGGIADLSSRAWNLARHPVEAVRAARAEGGDLGKATREAKGDLGSFAASVKSSTAKVTARTAGDAQAATATKVLARETAALSAAFAKLGWHTLAAGGSVTKAGIGKAGGALARGAGSLASSLGPLGIAAIGVPLAISAYGALKDRKAQANDLTPYLDPLKKLNDQYGIATTAVASFGKGVDEAAKALAQVTTFDQAARISAEDAATAAGAKVSDPGLQRLERHSKTDTAAQVAYLQSMGITDPKTLAVLKPQMIAAFGAQQAGTTLDAYNAHRGDAPDYTKIGKDAVGTEGRGIFGGALATNPSKEGNEIVGGAVGGIRVRREAASSKYNAGFGAQQELGEVLDLITSLTENSKWGTQQGAASRKTAANAAAQAFGGKSEDYEFTGDTSAVSKHKGDDLKRDYISLIAQSPEGKKYLAGVATGGGTLDPAKFSEYLDKLKTDTDSATGTALQGIGPVGAYVRGSASLKAAEGAPGDPVIEHRAMSELYEASMKVTGSFTGTVSAMAALRGAVKDETDVRYRAASAVAAYASHLQSFQMSTMTRGAQAQTVVGNLRTAQASLAANPGDKEGPKNVEDAKDAVRAKKQELEQHLVSVIQMTQQYNTQMERAREDRDTNLGRHERDFNLQMAQSEQDYHKGRLRATRDFGISMVQSEASFNRQRVRSQRDFDIQLKRQAEASAQSIYNPYLRVQAQYTTDAGTLLQNLADQNQRIAEQYTQIAKLRKAGVSQQAIDTLDLANPNNAQQLESIVGTLSPQLIAQINAAVATRVKATTKLTQSGFSVSFRQAVADFKRSASDGASEFRIAAAQATAAQKKSLDDMAADYALNRKRAVKANDVALSDMAFDFKRMMNRSAADLATSVTEITGTFQQLYPRAFDAVTTQLTKYAPKAAAIIRASLKSIKLEEFWNLAALAQTSGLALLPGQKHPGLKHAAAGGISTVEQLVHISEGNKAEAIIPLDARGANFMSGMYHAIARSVVAQMQTSAHPGMPAGAPTSTLQDYSTNYHIEQLTVRADDPKKLQAAMDAQRRLTKLARPPRATANA